jgi:predicted type IV restriction endonuclease
MDTELTDIIEKLKNQSYINEELVRVGIVLRILNYLQWNIWDPNEVSLEFKVTNEDNTKVDVAILDASNFPIIFIEIKSIGSINNRTLPEMEKQLRNYNRDNSARFTILTDGITWRFYYSLTNGEFSKKKFKEFHLINSNKEEVIESFEIFLSKKSLLSGTATAKAEEQLNLSRRERIIYESIHQATELFNQDPLLSKVEALIAVVGNKGHEISKEEAKEFILKSKEIKPIEVDHTTYIPTPQRTIVINPITQARPVRIFHPGIDIRWTKIITAVFCDETANNWNSLLRIAMKKALEQRQPIDRLQRLTGVKIFENNPNIRGYNKIGYRNYFSLDVEATKAYIATEKIANELNCKLYIKYRYEQGESMNKVEEIKINLNS